MNHCKVQEIRAEMSTLLNQQAQVMTNPVRSPLPRRRNQKWKHIKQETTASENLARN